MNISTLDSVSTIIRPMQADEALRGARHRAHLTQRQLAERTGVAQPTIARIERGLVEPRLGTYQRLLAACGHEMHVEMRAGFGIDRSDMRVLLKLTPRERVDRLRAEAAFLDRIDEAARR